MSMTTSPTSARHLTHYIDGTAAPTVGTAVYERRGPGDNSIVSVVPLADRKTVDSAVAAARAAFDEGPWPRMTGMERARVLNRLADLIDEDAEDLARFDAEESGKPLRTSHGDIAGAADLCRYAASLAITMAGISVSNAGPDYTGLVLREPVGVVGLIIPWNFPALILCQKLPFALAAGCTVVAKPSELTSTTAIRIAELCTRAGVPDGALNVVLGNGEAGARIAEHQDVDMISFTGSTRTGRAVLAAAAGNMKKVSLELGGKAASVVFADADLDKAVEGVLFGITFNNGECCVSQPRLLVEESVADEFLARLSRAYRAIKVGPPLSLDTDMGALIHEQHLDKVRGYVDRAVAEGATVLTGGQVLTGSEYGDGFYYAPTIVTDVPPTSPIFLEEVFGPVLAAVRFADEAEAIALTNSVEYGLSNTIWSQDIGRVLRVAKALKSGTVYVNTTIDAPPTVPFGGYKASGIGREMGQAGFEEFTELKTVNIRERTSSFPIPAV